MNPLGLLQDKFDCVMHLKAWVKTIIRRNKYLNLNVTASSDPVMLEYLKCRKGVLPDPEPLARRLHAIRWGIDKDFPELHSPASYTSTPIVREHHPKF